MAPTIEDAQAMVDICRGKKVTALSLRKKKIAQFELSNGMHWLVCLKCAQHSLSVRILSCTPFVGGLMCFPVVQILPLRHLYDNSVTRKKHNEIHVCYCYCCFSGDVDDSRKLSMAAPAACVENRDGNKRHGTSFLGVCCGTSLTFLEEKKKWPTDPEFSIPTWATTYWILGAPEKSWQSNCITQRLECSPELHRTKMSSRNLSFDSIAYLGQSIAATWWVEQFVWQLWKGNSEAWSWRRCGTGAVSCCCLRCGFLVIPSPLFVLRSTSKQTRRDQVRQLSKFSC